MGKSYRRPYSAVTGHSSAKEDKQFAARGLRRKQNTWLRDLKDFEEDGLVPHRLECPNNDVWGWRRDGRQRLQVPTSRHWSEYCRIEQGFFHSWERSWVKKHGNEWPPSWSVEVTRK